MRCRLTAACVLASVLVANAEAAETGFYVGAAFGEAETSDDLGLGNVYDDQDSAYKVLGGWRIMDWFGVEGGYFDLGNVSLQQQVANTSPFLIEQDGWGASTVFFIELASFDLFGKLGFALSSADLTTDTPTGQTSSVDRDTDFTWGVGAQWRFRKLALRLEYERLTISNGDYLESPALISAGMTWTF